MNSETCGTCPLTDNKPTTRTITVPIDQARAGDSFKGSRMSGGTKITYEGTLKGGPGTIHDNLYVTLSADYISGTEESKGWFDATITREVPAKTPREAVAELAPGTVFLIKGQYSGEPYVRTLGGFIDTKFPMRGERPLLNFSGEGLADEDFITILNKEVS